MTVTGLGFFPGSGHSTEGKTTLKTHGVTLHGILLKLFPACPKVGTAMKGHSQISSNCSFFFLLQVRLSDSLRVFAKEDCEKRAGGNIIS